MNQRFSQGGFLGTNDLGVDFVTPPFSLQQAPLQSPPSGLATPTFYHDPMANSNEMSPFGAAPPMMYQQEFQGIGAPMPFDSQMVPYVPVGYVQQNWPPLPVLMYPGYAGMQPIVQNGPFGRNFFPPGAYGPPQFMQTTRAGMMTPIQSPAKNSQYRIPKEQHMEEPGPMKRGNWENEHPRVSIVEMPAIPRPVDEAFETPQKIVSNSHLTNLNAPKIRTRRAETTAKRANKEADRKEIKGNRMRSAVKKQKQRRVYSSVLDCNATIFARPVLDELLMNSSREVSPNNGKSKHQNSANSSFSSEGSVVFMNFQSYPPVYPPQPVHMKREHKVELTSHSKEVNVSETRVDEQQEEPKENKFDEKEIVIGLTQEETNCSAEKLDN